MQLIAAALISMLPFVSLFKMAIITQGINALMLPAVFYFLINFTSDVKIMGENRNNNFQRYFAQGAIVVIIIAALLALIFNFI